MRAALVALGFSSLCAVLWAACGSIGPYLVPEPTTDCAGSFCERWVTPLGVNLLVCAQFTSDLDTASKELRPAGRSLARIPPKWDK